MVSETQKTLILSVGIFIRRYMACDIPSNKMDNQNHTVMFPVSTNALFICDENWFVNIGF